MCNRIFHTMHDVVTHLTVDHVGGPEVSLPHYIVRFHTMHDVVQDGIFRKKKNIFQCLI